ncbi:MAG: tRNA uridine-5-carboxymethylaminomethyl(34) synthesis GTPase MnmE [Rhizobiaceae bacterium]
MGGDTIVALSSGALPAAIAVIRVSGPQAGAVARRFGLSTDVAGRLARATFRGADGEELDRGLWCWFAAPGSATGADILELHVHGGKAVVQAVIAQALQTDGVRLAERGDFVRQAFLNGKSDLTAIEGIGALIEAETEAQRKLAFAGMSGQSRMRAAGWRKMLVEAMALIEAELDFSEEDDIPGSMSTVVRAGIRVLAADIEAQIARNRGFEIVRGGFKVVLLGAPNAGKSSLLNALALRDVAIVTDEPGTTRDLIDVALDLEGYKIVLTDTAGLRETGNTAERLGIERARESADRADLVLWLHDLAAGGVVQTRAGSLVVGTKLDVAGGTLAPGVDVGVSALTGEGLDRLIGLIVEKVREAVPEPRGLSISLREDRELRLAYRSLEMALGDGLELELVAEHLRAAADALARITGEVGVEELLDLIFSRFCIGK